MFLTFSVSEGWEARVALLGLWIKCLFSHLEADDSGESASRFRLVVTSVHPQLLARDPGASLMGQAQQSRAAGVPRSKAGRERTEAATSTHQISGMTDLHYRSYRQPGHKVGGSPPGDLPDPGIKPGLLSLLHRQVGSLPGKPNGLGVTVTQFKHLSTHCRSWV